MSLKNVLFLFACCVHKKALKIDSELWKGEFHLQKTFFVGKEDEERLKKCKRRMTQPFSSCQMWQVLGLKLRCGRVGEFFKGQLQGKAWKRSVDVCLWFKFHDGAASLINSGWIQLYLVYCWLTWPTAEPMRSERIRVDGRWETEVCNKKALKSASKRCEKRKWIGLFLRIIFFDKVLVLTWCL